MGHLLDGAWYADDTFPTDADGAFIRAPTTFRSWIRSDGSTPFAPAAGRYHLYVSHACPWAHRVMIARALLGLEHVVSVSVVHPIMGPDGWTFDAHDGVIPDPVLGAQYLREIYVAAAPRFTGRVTVPVLWDLETRTIVSNESRDILRMFSLELAALGHGRVELAPAALREHIDATIDRNYAPINNGVYRAGFATTQAAYERALRPLFEALAHCEQVLARRRFLCSDVVTEADICLFATLFRFDAVYYSHFKCNLHRVVDAPNLWGFVRDVHQLPGVAAVSRLDHAKTHYYRSHPRINPSGVVPVGPVLDFDAPHDRADLARP